VRLIPIRLLDYVHNSLTVERATACIEANRIRFEPARGHLSYGIYASAHDRKLNARYG
jgi:hypothetical protein